MKISPVRLPDDERYMTGNPINLADNLQTIHMSEAKLEHPTTQLSTCHARESLANMN